MVLTEPRVKYTSKRSRVGKLHFQWEILLFKIILDNLADFMFISDDNK